MRVVTGHKGIFHLETRVTGKGGALEPAAAGRLAMVAGRLISWLWRERQRRMPLAPTTPSVSNRTRLSIAALSMAERHQHHRALRFVTDIRTLPGEDPQTYFDGHHAFIREVVEPEMQAICPAARVDVDLPQTFRASESPGSRARPRLAKRLSGQNRSEVVPYAAESGQFRNAGFPVAMCGPGSIDQAHQPDGSSHAQLEAGTAFMRRLIETQSSFDSRHGIDLAGAPTQRRARTAELPNRPNAAQPWGVPSKRSGPPKSP